MMTLLHLDDPASAAGGRTQYHRPAAELPTAGKTRAPVGGGSGCPDVIAISQIGAGPPFLAQIEKAVTGSPMPSESCHE
jgi:hypothetical protein